MTYRFAKNGIMCIYIDITIYDRPRSDTLEAESDSRFRHVKNDNTNPANNIELIKKGV